MSKRLLISASCFSLILAMASAPASAEGGSVWGNSGVHKPAQQSAHPWGIQKKRLTGPTGQTGWGKPPEPTAPPPGFKTWTRPKQVAASEKVKAKLDAAAANGDEALIEEVKKQTTEHPEMADAIVTHAEAISANATAPAMGPGVFAAAASSVSGWTAASGVAATAGVAGLAGLAVAEGGGGQGEDSGGGGGGGGGSGGEGGDPDFEVDAEFGAGGGLGKINAEAAYATTTGSGVKVAVLDTGLDIDHPEFSGAIAAGGYDYVQDDDDPDVMTDVNGHGSHVTGTILARRDGIGMHGVAYNAQVIPYRVFSNAGIALTEPELADAFDRAVAADAKVVNNSWGTGVSIVDVSKSDIETDTPNMLAAWQDATAAGVAIVFAAGNDGFDDVSQEAGAPLYFPELRSLWLAVGSVDGSGTISAFSNRCGVAIDWCLVAPGEDILSAAPYDIATEDRLTDGYDLKSGTSMATPHVSGALALLLESFSGLTPEEAVEILLTTADDLGVAGPDEIYGQGLLDISAAMSAIGTTSIPASASISGASFGTGSSRISVSSAFGDSLKVGIAGKNLIILDGYNRAFVTGLDSFAKAVQDRFDAQESFASFAQKDTRQLRLTDNAVLSWTQGTKDSRLSDKPGAEDEPAVSRMSLTTDYGSAQTTAIYNDSPWQAFGAYGQGSVKSENLVAGDAFASPHLAVFNRDEATGATAALKDTRIGDIRAGAFYGGIDSGDEGKEAFAGIIELGLPALRGFKTALSSGTLVENSSMLGASGSGAFAFGHSTTVFGGATAELPVSDSLKILGGYHLGVTDMRQAQNSLMTGAQAVRSQGFSLGMQKEDALRSGDQMGFSFSQPLKITSGAAQIGLPSSRDANGHIGYTSEDIQLRPTGQELMLQGWYGTALESTGTELNIGAAYRHEPGHIKDANPEALGMIRLRQPLN